MNTLSPIELSFWYQYKFEPLCDANNIIHKLVFAEHISLSKIQKIFSLLSKKHPALRTNFVTVDGVPYRITHAELEPLVEDCTGMQSSILNAQARRTFNLESDAPIRVIYQSEHSKQTILHITSPHIVFDANSWEIMETDIVQLLQAQNDIETYDLIYPNVDPSDNTYWQSRLYDIEGRIFFEGSDDSQSREGNLGVINKEISDLFNRMEQYAQTANISMSAFCIATVATVLSKLNDSKKFIISTPVTTRDASHQNMIGSFINVMPLPIEIIQEETFTDFAQNVGNEIWGGIEHRNFSHFELIPGKVEKHVDSQGLYNVMVEHFVESALPNQILGRELVDNTFPKMDLIISFIKSEVGYRYRVEYNIAKLSKNYVLDLLSAIMETCNKVLNNSHVLINQIPLIDEAAKAELALIGSGAHKKISNPFVWPRFKKMAETYPNNIAIAHGTRHVSYKDLYSKVMVYRAKLKTAGVAQNHAVGVYLPRNMDYVASMLAIWSLGAIYVPLDKNQPVERLSSMIAQSGIKLIVSDLEISFKDYAGHILLITDVELGAEAVTHENIKQSPSDTAYIIFTSGSTGQPKGVMIEHLGFMNHLEIMIKELQLNPCDVIAQTAPVSFDISVWQLICPLIIGASLIIVEQAELLDAEKIYTLITKKSISVLEIVPSLLSAYLDAEDLMLGLRFGLSNTKLITTGEAISRSVALKWCENYPKKPLLNAYGPAEASDDTHFFSITRQSISELEYIPIGHSLLNIKTYIVNSELQLLPRGHIGEICIGGISVSKGYVQQPELTKASFVEIDTFGKKQKWYRTGDYGRWTDKNALEYHGRRDQQVKIHGQRLEIGEVESRISLIDIVKEVAVNSTNQLGSTKLRCFLVPSSQDVTLESIKCAIADKLPFYMIPWKIIIVEALPRNANGKLDRLALDAIPINAANGTEIDLPTDRKLKLIISAYSESLGVVINPHSNYFESGGDSIASMKIVSKLEHAGINVGVRDILVHQTPLELFIFVKSKQEEEIQQSKRWPRLDENTPIQKTYLNGRTKKQIDTDEVQAALLFINNSISLNRDEITSALVQLMVAHRELKPYKSSKAYIAPSIKLSSSTELHTLVSDLRQNISLKQPITGCIVNKDGSQYVLLIANHFVIDFYSWHILRKDIIRYIQDRTIPDHDDMLQKWWGNAKQNFRPTKQAKKYWQSHSIPVNNKIKNHTMTSSEKQINLVLNTAFKSKIQDYAVSMESLAQYLIIQAYFKVEDIDSFFFKVESSIRNAKSSSILMQSIGWMTYTYPHFCLRKDIASMNLLDFHKLHEISKEKGLEYSLLIITNDPDLQKSPEPMWTINYIGSSIDQNENVHIIKTPIYSSLPFIELDILCTDSELKFIFSNNINLSDGYIKSFKKFMGEVVLNIDTQLDSKVHIDIGEDRAKSILERLNDGN